MPFGIIVIWSSQLESEMTQFFTQSPTYRYAFDGLCLPSRIPSAVVSRLHAQVLLALNFLLWLLAG